MPDSCITPVYLCITSYSCFVKHTVFFLLSKYLDYNRLVCNLPKHPGVGAMNIRMSRAATSGCMKPEDGRVPVHFRLLFTFFLLVFCKKVSYVDEITFLQMYIDMFPSVFETIPAICFNVRESDTSVT